MDKKIDTKSKMKIKPKRLVLLDAHAILHRAYHALPDFSTAKGEPTGALYGLSAMIIKIIEDLKPDYVIACYDLKGPTYRHELYKEYKAGRKPAEDDLVAQMIRSRDIFESMNIVIYDRPGFEADDMLGTIVEQLLPYYGKNSIKNKSEPIEIVIASGDMDTLQLVYEDKVKVYTLKKGINDTIMYDEQAVLDRFGFGPLLLPDYKGLRGDPSDNIIGIKGIGEKTATILISTFGSLESIYKELEAGHEIKFSKAGLTPRIIQLLKDNKEEAEFSKMLATIRRDAPIEFKIPEKTFRDSLDIKKVTELWTKLEFRTLVQRLQKAISNGVVGSETSNKNKDGQSQIIKEDNNEKQNKLFIENTDNNDEIEKTLLALWLVNSNLTNPNIEDALNFANTDDFIQAKNAIFVELDKRGLVKLYEEIELPLIPITKKMEVHGIKIDTEVLNNLSKNYHKEVNRLEKEIIKLAGVEFNINSPKQLGEVLFDKMNLTAKNLKKTAGGARSTRESELEKLRDLHPIIPMIFEYRELQKLLSTYIDAIPPLLDEKNRLHSHLVSAGSTTGRMASLNPNLQNIPVKTELGRAIRHAFIAEQGRNLCSFDYSQMELRIAAFLSGDEKLIEIFKNNEDVHTSVASFVFKLPKEKITSVMRNQAKVINFGIIYGMGVSALKQNLGTTREEAQNFYNEYFQTFSTLAKYLDSIKAETARRGYTETFYGRRRYFEGINSKIPFIRASAERMAINAPIQGTEADVIKLAMIKIDKFISEQKLENDVFPLLQVHDELVYEITEKKSEEISKEIVMIMESVMDIKDTKGVILKASSAIGNNWGELK